MTTRETQSAALLILGMHRSGTSAVTRVVNLLGADIGDEHIAKSDANPAGVWELRDVVALNDEVLEYLGFDWTSIQAIDSEELESVSINGFVERARQILDQFDSSPLFALKDPRLCRLAILWRRAIRTKPLKAVFVLRSPEQVADSLLRRDGIPREHGMLLWTRYNLAAFKCLRDQ